jgi:hypothetical protein
MPNNNSKALSPHHIRPIRVGSPEDGDGIQSPKRRVPKYNTGRWIMSRIVIVALIYHRHKPIALVAVRCYRHLEYRPV